jgi:hypothetical protein
MLTLQNNLEKYTFRHFLIHTFCLISGGGLIAQNQMRQLTENVRTFQKSFFNAPEFVGQKSVLAFARRLGTSPCTWRSLQQDTFGVFFAFVICIDKLSVVTTVAA